MCKPPGIAKAKALDRFKRLLHMEPTDDLLRERADKIREELGKIDAQITRALDGGGTPTDLVNSYRAMGQRLADIMDSADRNSVRDVQLDALKTQARVVAAGAAAAAEAAIAEGAILRAEHDRAAAAERLRLEVEDRKQRVAALLAGLDQELAGASGPLLAYAAQVARLRQEQVAAAAAERTDMQDARAKYGMLANMCATLAKSVADAKPCVKPAADADFWIAKLQEAVTALPPDEGRSVQQIAGATELREGVPALVDAKQAALDGRLSHMLGALTDVCNDASKLYEKVKKSVVAATLHGTASEQAGQLDTLAAGLKGHDDLESQATCRAAIALRYQMEFANSDEFANPLGGGIKGLNELYDVMAMVPSAHLAVAGGLMKLSYKEAKGAGERDNKFAARDKGGREELTVVLTLPTDGERIKKKNAAGVELEESWFQSTALHEIGHAVDHVQKFMDTHRGSAGYGQSVLEDKDKVVAKYLEIHGPSVAEPARPELKTFIEASLDGRQIKKPVAPSDAYYALLAWWDALEALAVVLQSIRETNAIWYKGGAAATAATISGRVYFQSNAIEWWSFARIERDASVSEYQWKAPGEWFAEAYSLYYLGKLDARHPVAVWCAAQPAPGT